MIDSAEHDSSPGLHGCADEQVQIIGHIQPHGLLFALSEPDFLVRQVSTNIATFLGMSPESVLGRSFEAVLGAQSFEAFRTHSPAGQECRATTLRLPVRDGMLVLECIAHRQDGLLIVELEPSQGAHSPSPLDFDAHIRIPISRMGAASDIPHLARLAVSAIRNLGGFTRVMVYRFDQEWNGEVMAESVGPSPISYLGLRFPAGDIPPQVRQLFLVNAIRAIVDVDAMSAPIVPAINPLTEKPLDLTYSVLRSASPIHLEYLRNMGVQSSLTLSILVDGRLWGMIACHNDKAHRLARSTRSVCELIGQTLAAQVALRTRNAALESQLAARAKLDIVTAGIGASESIVEAAQSQAARLLELFDADGLVSCLEGVETSQGITLETKLLYPVIGKLRNMASRGVAGCDQLGKWDRELAAHAGLVSGGLYIGLAGNAATEAGGDYLLFLRRELAETISWAGNPNEAVMVDRHDRLHPRKSFEPVRQTVQGVSRPWTDKELENGLIVRENMLQLGVITAHKRDEQALHKSEERFYAMADGCPSIMWVSNRDGEIDFINRAFRIFFGTTREEVQLGKWHLLIHPEDAMEYVAGFHRAVAEQKLFRAEARVRRADGEWRMLGSNAEPLRSPGGEYLGHIGVSSDITNRMEAERALRSSEEKFRQLAENIREVFFILAPFGGEVLYISPAAEEIWGVTVESLYRNPTALVDAIHPDDREQARLLAARQSQGDLVASEYRIRTPDGKEKWIRARCSPIRDQAGELIRIVGIAEEITERRHAEDLLKQSADRLALAVRAGGVGIWDFDLRNNVLVWDEQMFRLYGTTCEQFGGAYQAWQAGLHPEDRGRGDVEMIAAIRGENEFDTEFRVVWPDGSIHHIRANALVKRDASDKAIQIVGTNWDITSEKEAANVLIESNLRLEQETMHARKSSIAAEAASRVKGQFLATMSHEIRTPMNGIIGMTELILGTTLTAQQRRYAGILRDSGKSLLHIVDDILDFSKIEAKKLQLEAVDFDLRELLENIVGALSIQAEAKGLELLSTADAAIPSLLCGDPGRLQQILTNLLGNSIKFTEKGEVTVRATLEQDGDPDCLIRFLVRDTGIGIPQDKIGLLFHSFTQVDDSTTRKFGGTGLGLAISRQLAELMGGGVGVTSKEGSGSEFWATVRLRRSTSGEAGTGIDQPPILSGVRLLIVDDNTTSREILTTLTGGWGMRPFDVEGGPWALQALYRAREQDDPFQVAVVDMQMPGMDGEGLCRAIKADPRLAETRTIMLTPLGIQQRARDYEQMGFFSCATKPVRRQELLSLLINAMSAPAGSRPAEVRQREPQQANHDLSKPFAGINARILLAEDNSTNREVALGMLQTLGLTADVVFDGAEALAALASIPYDLVLMDMRMPVMDGIEATRQIRDPLSAVLNHSVFIIAMTADALDSQRTSCLAAGMNDFVAKPVSTASLRSVLEKWLLAGASTGPAAQLAPSPAAESEPLLFDLAGVLERLMGDKNLATIVMEGFLNDIPQQIQVLKDLVQRGDTTGSARQAHSIKGASAIVGGERLRKAAAEMERAADAGEMDAVANRMADLEAQFLLLRDAIDDECHAKTRL